MEHNHAHGHHCECGQETKTENLAELYNLYSKIDMENLECLNEAVENSVKSVFRPWDQRLDSTKVILSLFFMVSRHKLFLSVSVC